MNAALSRREFLCASAAVGGGLALEFYLPLAAAAGVKPNEVTAWLLIYPDDRVIVRIARSEMGQGTLTALAQLVAEELDCDWDKVGTEFASPNANFRRHRVWGSMSTGGSQGIRGSQDYVRRAGATAREMLRTAAAARWRVAVSECQASRGIIHHRASGRTLRYGQVAAEAANLEPPKDVALRDSRDWRIAGQPLARLDIPDKVRGEPVYGVDVSLPRMLHASIAQCPVFGGSVKSVDSKDAEAMRGVRKVVQDKDFVAVVADSWWRANEAIKKVRIEWDPGQWGSASDATIAAMLREGLTDPGALRARELGDAPGALAKAAKVLEAEYQSPYLNHATMEPQTCTAWFRPDGFLDVWTSTQDGEGSMKAAAAASGLPLEQIEVHKMMLGGGFGRRGAPQDFVRQGVSVAKALPGMPVKLMWSREEDMQHGFYRPASMVRMKAGLDAEGNLIALQTAIACPSILKVLVPQALEKEPIDFTAVRFFSDLPYTVPHQRVDYSMRNGHVPVGFWRAPGQQNGFYRECFLDEVAVAIGRDPVEFRRRLLKEDDKNRLVLEAVVKAAGWGSRLPSGVGRGIAVADGFGSYTAMVAEVSVKDGTLNVHRIVVAIDSGYVVNPDTCRAQAEGNVLYGLGSVLNQEIHIKDGRVVETNFNDFPLPRIGQMPTVVETVLAPTGGFWGGHGEPAILPLTPAICNAVYAATGKRIRTLPLTGQDLRKT
jgi:isoquinoline 1-oxidoreductase beta subunit